MSWGGSGGAISQLVGIEQQAVQLVVDHRIDLLVDLPRTSVGSERNR